MCFFLKIEDYASDNLQFTLSHENIKFVNQYLEYHVQVSEESTIQLVPSKTIL